ncbi:MAG: molybdenum cofactor guanylyltransferase [Bryobacteraceae bacterium]
MRHAGFVLTGGISSRMGRDKALLPYGGRKLVDYIASQVLEAAGSASLIGSPVLYGHFGYPVYPDEIPQCGPLGGIYTALRLRRAEWNLIVACDLPNVRAADLRRILEASASAGDRADCVIPLAADGGWQPLCAAYHSRCAPEVECALGRERFKMMDLLAKLKVVRCSGLRPELFVNVNTPTDWEKIEEWQTSQ